MTTKKEPHQVLILTIAGDFHAYAVAEALKKKGVEPIVWHTSDFPHRGAEGVLFEAGQTSFHLQDADISLVDPEATTVWNRRTSVSIDQELLHPADREFARIECRLLRRSFLELLSRNAFWVNPWAAAGRAECKPIQHALAAEVGLRTPATFYGNDPELIRTFLDRHGGRVIYKGLAPSPWSDGEKIWMPYTSTVTKSDLPDDEILRCTPGIYQEIVEKDYELRVTVMGDRLFTIKLLSQETPKGHLDWRRSYKEVAMEPCELEADLTAACLEVVKRMGLVFGCFDFIVTPSGEYIFLEVNQMGQFLFVEVEGGLPLLDAFTEFLIQARPDFEWDPAEAEVFYTSEMEQEVLAIAERENARHVPAPLPQWKE